ncbi:uncharacterized protein LOC105172868 [Sesamum indicum]|uniref:Uncharacterized protein LOC105172868 n=1 Tax=Sesamum indicum TaxID=4182 RepID=A0A8M8V1Z7_SESIN|nr:uncharacterized protein LOC105172868 [Sesamum indicum]
MGSCWSHQSTSALTAKLILLDGQLQEFSWPVRVSSLLEPNSGCFICSSEEMELDEFAVAMSGDEVLQPGELYFEMPLDRRNRRLQVEDMAALVLKASAALASCSSRDYDDGMISCSCCVWGKVRPVMLFSEKERLLAAEDGGGNGGGGGCKRRKFVAKLSAIDEE